MNSYLADCNDSRLPSRIAQASRLQVHVPPASAYPGPGTSMLLSGDSSLAALTRASSAASLPSASSAMGGRALEYGRVLRADQHDVLQIPPLSPTIVFECPFQFNHCLLTFTNYSQWFNHSLEHFKRHDPPAKNKCCFCDKEFNETNGLTSWKRRMEEIASHHQLGHRLAHARPDFELFKYLWDKKIIGDAHYKNLMGAKGLSAYSTPPTSPNSSTASPTSDAVYTVTHDGRRRGQRGRERR